MTVESTQRQHQQTEEQAVAKTRFCSKENQSPIGLKQVLF